MAERKEKQKESKRGGVCHEKRGAHWEEKPIGGACNHSRGKPPTGGKKGGGIKTRIKRRHPGFNIKENLKQHGKKDGVPGHERKICRVLGGVGPKPKGVGWQSYRCNAEESKNFDHGLSKGNRLFSSGRPLRKKWGVKGRGGGRTKIGTGSTVPQELEMGHR